MCFCVCIPLLPYYLCVLFNALSVSLYCTFVKRESCVVPRKRERERDVGTQKPKEEEEDKEEDKEDEEDFATFFFCISL